MCELVSYDVANFLRGAFIPLHSSNESGLRRAATRLHAKLREVAGLWNHPTLAPSPDDIVSVRRTVEEFQAVLTHDSHRVNLYFIPQRLAYDTDTLLERAEQAIPNAALLSELAREDVREAGRCLALGRPMATAFHILRAVESVMRAYLKALAAPEPGPGDTWTWAKFINVIGGTRKAPPRLVYRLEKLKDYERDELFHVEREALLTEDDGAEIFDYAKGAIVAMLRHMQTLEGRE